MGRIGRIRHIPPGCPGEARASQGPARAFETTADLLEKSSGGGLSRVCAVALQVDSRGLVRPSPVRVPGQGPCQLSRPSRRDDMRHHPCQMQPVLRCGVIVPLGDFGVHQGPPSRRPGQGCGLHRSRHLTKEAVLASIYHQAIASALGDQEQAAPSLRCLGGDNAYPGVHLVVHRSSRSIPLPRG